MHQKVKDILQNKFSDSVLSQNEFRGQAFFQIRPGALLEICETLQTDPHLEFSMLSDVTCVDWLGHGKEAGGRFEVIYNLYSITNRHRVFLTVRLGDPPAVPSLCGLWSSANWLEREVFDLFGVIFEGHPDLKKIVTPDELEGHPLRQDFPLTYEMPQFSHNKNEPPEVIK